MAAGNGADELELNVKVVQGTGLAACDKNGLSDPYVRLQVGKLKGRTAIKKKTLDPVWDEEFPFGRVASPVEIQLECWDWDKMSSDDFMGRASCVLDGSDFKMGPRDITLQLLGRGKDENVSGSIVLRVTLEAKKSEAEAAAAEAAGSSKRRSTKLCGRLRRNTVNSKRDLRPLAEGLQEPERTNPTWGVELHELMEKQKRVVPEMPVPHFCRIAIEWLRGHGVVDSMGVFRVGGVALQMKALREEVECAPLAGAVLPQDTSIHNVTGLLKAYLRELPEPLLTFDLFPKVFREQEPEEPPPVAEVARELEALPVANLRLLSSVLRLARDIADNAAVNRMDAQNLAIVIGPNLLWKRVEEDTLESLMSYRASLAVITSAVQALIENFHALPVLCENSAAAASCTPGGDLLGAISSGRQRRRSGPMGTPPPLQSLADMDAKELFNSFDADGSGALDPIEFAIFFKDLMEASGKGCPTNRAIMEATNAVDADGDGEITFEEFNRWWTTVR